MNIHIWQSRPVPNWWMMQVAKQIHQHKTVKTQYVRKGKTRGSGPRYMFYLVINLTHNNVKLSIYLQAICIRSNEILLINHVIWHNDNRSIYTLVYERDNNIIYRFSYFSSFTFTIDYWNLEYKCIYIIYVCTFISAFY